MAESAAFRLKYRVFVDERPRRLRVALGADQVLVCGGLKLVALERTMRIVAIRALELALFHGMMEGLGER